MNARVKELTKFLEDIQRRESCDNMSCEVGDPIDEKCIWCRAIDLLIPKPEANQ